MIQRRVGSCQNRRGSRPSCLTTGLPANSVQVIPPSTLLTMHSPRPVLVYAATSGALPSFPNPDVLAWSTTADPENAQSPYW